MGPARSDSSASWSFSILHAAPAGVRVRSVCGKSETCNPLLPTDGKKRANYVKFFPAHRKLGENSVDKTPGLWLSGEGWDWSERGAAPRRVVRRRLTNARNDAENSGQIIRYGEVQSSQGRGKVARGGSPEKKMLINNERSQYMYENKQKYDNLSPRKDDISAQLRAISMPFCTETNLFCRNRRLFYHYSSAGERTARFKM